LEQGHPGPEGGEGLRQLTANRPAADDGEPVRSGGEREDRLVREVAALPQTGYGRDGWTRPGRDDRTAEAEHRVPHLYGVRAGEGGVTQEDIGAEAAESLRAVVFADLGADPAHALQRRDEVSPALASRPGPLGERSSLLDERLRWDAADVQAVAAEEGSLHQRNAGAERHRDRGR